ncbi:MAG: translation factor GTPase family protein [Clostridia bacterium]|nr:translation factor GTPase family protein [Clostridia bacterium]
MKKVTVGIFAHVDAGKTTLSEQLLYQSGTLRAAGRVDHGDTALDRAAVERERGITVFSDTASFLWGDTEFFLVDTPGHLDFFPETQRVLPVLDGAVLVVSAGEGLRGQTLRLWEMLRGIPTVIFINKTDLSGVDLPGLLAAVRQQLGGVCPADREEIAECSEELLELYLAGKTEGEEWKRAMGETVRQGAFSPVFCGSALHGRGVKELLDGMKDFLRGDYREEAAFQGVCYKIHFDKKGTRLAFCKVLAGCLRPKDRVPLAGGEETVHELRRYRGDRWEGIAKACAGEICALTGLPSLKAGMYFGQEGKESPPPPEPPLSARVESSTDPREVWKRFQLLEEQEPCLRVRWEERLGELQIRVMGPVALEVLAAVYQEQFGEEIGFSSCGVVYQETLAEPVIGRGHFEPLRHYAEVKLGLAPGERGSGIRFDSRGEIKPSLCRLVQTHVLEREHKGVLTGSPLCDVKITLLAARDHEKHTEGGDFRQAVYRAVRQGLRKGKSLLLEPYYRVTVRCPAELAGRVCSDLLRMHGRFDPPKTVSGQTEIRGEAPVVCVMEYPKEVAAFTKGMGDCVLEYCGYQPCHNPEEVIAQRAYCPDQDVEHTADSVFCSHGRGFTVPWDQADGYMHLE